ncbi:hypothetical protein K2X85_09600 [bacterium]|jgi:hypothetical protein|nr:hypothetical protein [bacterium]
MSTVISAFFVVGLMVIGFVSLAQSRRTSSLRLRQRNIRWAMGAFGTLTITVLVTLLGETVQTLVIIAASFWLARHLYRGTSPWVRFLEKKVASLL